MASYTGLHVVECRWWRSGNVSIRPLFETVASLHDGNPHSIRYDMFTSASSLAAIVKTAASDGRSHTVYVAAHGKKDRLLGLAGAKISRARLRNLVRANNVRGRLSGLYLGGCLMTSAENAAFMLNDNRTRLRWVAGYSKGVDWIDSSAFDMMFWSNFLCAYEAFQGGNSNRAFIVERALQEVASTMRPHRSLAASLGFQVYLNTAADKIVAVW